MFVFIGAEPYTRWLADEVALDSGGYILTGGRHSFRQEGRAGLHRSAVPAGDQQSGCVRGRRRAERIDQTVASAVGEGAMAVRLVREHLQLRG